MVYELNFNKAFFFSLKRIHDKTLQYNMKYTLLRCVTTDGGRNIYGSGHSLVGLIYKAWENTKKAYFFYCITWTVLCGK